MVGDAYDKIVKELSLQGITITRDSKLIISFVIKEMAKEVFKYDEKAYLALLEKYNV